MDTPDSTSRPEDRPGPTDTTRPRAGPDRERDGIGPQMPADAGGYRERLERILRRIPAGWRHRLDVSPDWYPILVELDEKLATMDPDYRVHRVKERDGVLHFDAYPGPMPDPECCVEFAVAHPAPGRDDDPTAREQWSALWETHHASEDHISHWENFYETWKILVEEREQRMAALITQFGVKP